MYEHISGRLRLRIALAPGVPSLRLSTLLQLQRAEEPEVTIVINEATNDFLLQGLREQRYDVGMSLHHNGDPSLRTQPLWKERIAAALPPAFPLLDRGTNIITDLHDYPIYRWQAEACFLLDQMLDSTVRRLRRKVQWVTSFESMALCVAAGYGIGLSAQSRIEGALGWGITMQSLAGGPYEVVTYLQRPYAQIDAVSERFERRALRVANFQSE